MSNMIVCIVACATSLFVGEHTFRARPSRIDATNRTRRTLPDNLWREVWAADAASQMATWLAVEYSDFPELEWASLEPNVLAHYDPSGPIIRLNTHFYDDFFAEPIVLRMTMLHELLHAFSFGHAPSATARDAQWEVDFDTNSPGVVNYHWNKEASSGYHRRTRLHANAEVMQATLDEFSHLTMAALKGTSFEIRYGCETNNDCSTMRRHCILDSDHWVGTCSFIGSDAQNHGAVVLSIVLVVVVIIAMVVALTVPEVQK